MNDTIEHYNKRGFLEWRTSKEFERKKKGEPTFWKEEMDVFLDIVNEGDLLEIGPGVGFEAKYLLSKGRFDSYTGIEPAYKLAAYCRIALKHDFSGKIKIVNRSVETFLITKKYQALVSVCSLIHIDKYSIGPVLSRIREACDVGACGWIVMLQNDKGEVVKTKDNGLKLYFYKFSEFKNLLDQAGFFVFDESRIVEKAGQKWQVFYVLAI